MPTVKELLRAGRKDELWQMCCGFLDLNVDQFMAIQRRLLMEQIELLNKSTFGRRIMRGIVPQSVEEFRNRVPLSTYADYCPELRDQREDVLPVKPLFWQHTSGRSCEYPFKWETIKWVPITPAYSRELGIIGTACAILAGCESRGDVYSMKEGLKYIYAVAPRPYTSGTYAYIASEEIAGRSLPPLDIAEKMSFEERIEVSFKQALTLGFDYYFGVTVALVAIDERIQQRMGKIQLNSLFMDPRALARVVRGLIKSKMAGRRLLPGDLWSIKGILSSGTDGTIFRQVIKDSWGRYPLNLFASTEAGIVATQAWDYGSMTFYPSLNFLEFIPEEEYEKWQNDNSYVPATVLLNELRAGEKYELVITNFHGNPLVRYRTADIIRITALKNDKLNINIPQMEFEGRVDDLMDIGGFIRLNEKVIWQAVTNTGIAYADLVARKEVSSGKTILHVYIEPKEDNLPAEIRIAESIYGELKKMDENFLYGNVESVLNTMPIEVTYLPKGAFMKYINLRREQVADLAHLKPRHINPSDKELVILGVNGEAHPGAEKSFAGTTVKK